jgi:superfamily II DNA/RNA helicase
LFLYTKIVVESIPVLSYLNEPYAIAEFSRNQDQKTRKRIIKSFSTGVTKVWLDCNYLPVPLISKLIICSDILARGIDIEGVTKIVNYEMPSSTPRYIHRYFSFTRFIWFSGLCYLCLYYLLSIYLFICCLFVCSFVRSFASLFVDLNGLILIVRVGRTARAGSTGISYALLTSQDQVVWF